MSLRLCMRWKTGVFAAAATGPQCSANTGPRSRPSPAIHVYVNVSMNNLPANLLRVCLTGRMLRETCPVIARPLSLHTTRNVRPETRCQAMMRSCGSRLLKGHRWKGSGRINHSRFTFPVDRMCTVTFEALRTVLFNAVHAKCCHAWAHHLRTGTMLRTHQHPVTGAPMPTCPPVCHRGPGPQCCEGSVSVPPNKARCL